MVNKTRSSHMRCIELIGKWTAQQDPTERLTQRNNKIYLMKSALK